MIKKEKKKDTELRVQGSCVLLSFVNNEGTDRGGGRIKSGYSLSDFLEIVLKTPRTNTFISFFLSQTNIIYLYFLTLCLLNIVYSSEF